MRGAVLTATGDASAGFSLRHDADAVVVIDNGRITDVGPARDVVDRMPPRVSIERIPASCVIVPGFVDCHVHYAQLPIIASHGTQLLDWLERYTFAAEQAMSDPDRARDAARSFFDETLRCGTTTVMSFCTVHPASVDAFFEEARSRGVRAIGGKVLMDRHAPAPLCDTAQRGYDESLALIDRWHGRGRIGYAITPRFAPTSSAAQLEAAGALWKAHPDCWMQSHVAENHDEIAWVRQLFPEARDYVDVYARFGLLGRRAVYGHGIHLSDAELDRLAQTGTAIAHCPTSNLFLGSGIFPWRRIKARPVAPSVGFGTDVGGGTSLSMLATAAEAYKVAQLAGCSLGPAELLYRITHAGAQALGLDDRIGAIATGYEADLVVLDLEATSLLAQRTRTSNGIDEALFALLMLGDDRAVASTWAGGRCVYRRDDRESASRPLAPR
ncbi:MAG TPA: guanine deaminase [Casimicrobiaceae bacterium]|nr:guanine deaminase [Casimicrobiaceae bacterium]